VSAERPRSAAEGERRRALGPLERAVRRPPALCCS